MFERFSGGARAAVGRAQQEARAMAHPVLGTEHLLLGVLGHPEGVGGQALRELGLDLVAVRAAVQRLVGHGDDRSLDAEALRSIGIDLDAVRKRVEDAFGPGALGRTGRCRRGQLRGHLLLSKRVKKVLELALREAVRRKEGFIGTEHLLLGIFREGRGVAAMVLAEFGIDRPRLEQALDRLGRDGRADAG